MAYNFVESIFLHVNWKEIRNFWGEWFVRRCLLGKKLRVFSKYIFIGPSSSLEIYERCVMHEKWELNILGSLFFKDFQFVFQGFGGVLFRKCLFYSRYLSLNVETKDLLKNN